MMLAEPAIVLLTDRHCVPLQPSNVKPSVNSKSMALENVCSQATINT